MEKRVKMKKTAKILLAAILIAVILVNLLTIVFSSLGLRKQLNWVPWAFLTVTSGSMEPEISAGDMILVYETPYEELEIGDYVTYFDVSGGFTTHELIRRGENSFETKGIANDRADDVVNRGAYCARTVAVFPGMGMLLDFFTQPVPAIVSILLIIVLFYGIPFIKNRKSPEAVRRTATQMRGITALALASIFACAPFMTAARYVSDINEFAVLQAAQVNFKSNYMSQVSVTSGGEVSGGNTYDISGWDGNPYTMKVEIQNYGNQLRYNTIDVPYVIYLENVEGEESGYIDPDKYTIDIDDKDVERYRPSANGGIGSLSTSSAGGSGKIYDPTAYTYHRDVTGNIWLQSGIQGPYLLRKSDTPANDTFTLSIELKEGISITEKDTPLTDFNVRRGDKLHFKIMSCTNYKEQFYQELKGEFTIQIAESDQFLVPTITDSATSTAANSILSANIVTNLVGTGEERMVYIYWDASRMYLDELDPTGANAIANYRNSYYNGKSTPEKGDQVKGIGYLKLPMQAKSNYTFQFIKKPEYVYENLSKYIDIRETELSTAEYEGHFPIA